MAAGGALLAHHAAGSTSSRSSHRHGSLECSRQLPVFGRTGDHPGTLVDTGE